MKVLVIFAFILLLIGSYFYSKKTVSKKNKYRPGLKTGLVVTFVVLFLVGFTGVKLHEEKNQPDLQCSKPHKSSSVALQNPTTPQDFFEQGNFDYETGNCQQAVIDYTKAIELNPSYAESYNNRAFTNMRLRNYSAALPDLDKAIEIRPNYMNAYLNRGDLFNYYGPVIDRQKAIADYDKAISLGADKKTSVCGHRAMAQTNNNVPLVFLHLIFATHC